MSFGVCIGNDSVSIAVYQDEPVTVVNQAGHRVTAAAVSFSEGEIVVGDTAKGVFVKRGPRQVLHTIPYVFANTEDVAKVRAKRLGVELCLDDSENITALTAYTNNDEESSQKVTFEDVFAHIFRFCKREVEAYLGTSVTSCVVVLDDDLCDKASSATTVAKAADVVGLEVKRIMRPCTASLLAALPNLDPGTENSKLISQNILVIDMGALHTTTTAVCCEQGLMNIVSRDSVDFGGRDCDMALYKHFAEEFRRKAKIDLADDKRAQRKLIAACEEAKKTMTSRGEGLIQIEALSEGIDFSSKIARGRYESLITKFMPTVVSSASKCLQASNFSKPDVIVFIGGASNTAAFRNQISSTFGSDIPVIAKAPEEIVVLGAAIQSHVCSLSGVGVPVGGIWQKAAKGSAGKENDAAGVGCNVSVSTADIGVKSATGEFMVMVPAGSLLPAEGKLDLPVPEGHTGGILVDIVEGTDTLCQIPLKQLASQSVKILLSMAADCSLSVSVSDSAGNKAVASVPAP